MTGRWRGILRSPLVIAVSGIVLSAIGVGVSAGFSPLWAMPNFAMIFAFMILGKGSAEVETLAILILGLCYDLLSGDVPGAGTLGLFAGMATTRLFVMRFDLLRPAWKGLIFIVFAGVALFVEWALTSLAAFSTLPLTGTILQFVLTCVVFAFYSIFRQLLRRWQERSATRYGLLGGHE